MTTYKTTVISILTFFATLTTNAENKLARINDLEGFSNVRSGQSKNSSIVDKLAKNDFFYCENTKSDWLKIIALKWKDGQQIEGFIHKSRVQFIEDLSINTKKQLLTQILLKQKELATNFQKAWKSKNKLAYKTTVKELETHSEIKYSPILDVLPKYFSETIDIPLLQLFFSTMWADKNSANEIPSFAIGLCYIFQPDTVIKQVKIIKNSEQRTLIFNQIEWGLMNHFNIDEDEKSENKEFNKLKKRLDIEIKKASP